MLNGQTFMVLGVISLVGVTIDSEGEEEGQRYEVVRNSKESRVQDCPNVISLTVYYWVAYGKPVEVCV